MLNFKKPQTWAALIVVVFILVAAAFCLTKPKSHGETKVQENSEIEVQENSETEVRENSETEVQETSRALSEEEIAGFNQEFFNGETINMHNMLLSSAYSKPEQIDLFQLFYNGIAGADNEISDEERAKLAELDSEAYDLDIVKISIEEMDAFLRANLGLGLEETEKNGLDDFYYLDTYKSYYWICGDTNYDFCTVISGTWESDSLLSLQYEKESDGSRWIVTLQKNGTGYRFLSNVESE